MMDNVFVVEAVTRSEVAAKATTTFALYEQTRCDVVHADTVFFVEQPLQSAYVDV